MKTPSTLLEAVRMYADPEVARRHFVGLRWPNGMACIRCGSVDVREVLGKRPRWFCRDCKSDFTAKTGTIFEDSPIGFDKWLPAMWILTNTKNGTSSYELARDLGVMQRTAWFMLHRLRHAMQTGTFEKLRGPVEADETYVGGKARSFDQNPETGKLMPTGPQENKTIVMGIVERKGSIRAFVIDNVKGAALHGKIKENVAEGSTVYTDALKSYAKMEKIGKYSHFVINHDERFVDGHIHTNNVENFWSLLKRTIKGTYIAPRPWHLQRYVQAQAFRYNGRDMNDAGRFVAAAEQADGKRITYKQLTANVNPEQARTKERQRAAALRWWAARG